MKICDLREHSEYLSESTASRFFRGESINAKSRARIIEEISRSFGESMGDSRRLLSASRLGMAAATWDGVRRTAQTLESFRGLGTAPVLILREAAVNRAREFLPPSGAHGPPRASRYGFDKWLRQQLDASRWRLTRERLAGLLGHDEHTIDAWLDRGAVPSREKIQDLARLFGERLGVEPSKLVIEIRQRCSISRLANWLQRHVPQARREWAA